MKLGRNIFKITLDVLHYVTNV